MALITGLTAAEVDDLIAGVEAQAQASLRLAIHRVQARLGQVLVAAGPGPAPGDSNLVNVDDLGLIQSTWVSEVDDVLTPQLAAAFGKSADAVAAHIGQAFPGYVVPAVSSALAEQHLGGAVNRMKHTGSVVWEQARNQLLDGVKAGESIDELSARLENTLAMTEADATRVAQTEVISATNAGSYAMAQTTGLQMEKQWMATEDMRTRPTHTVADGQLQPLASPFQVGGYQLQYPGDPSGPAGEVINCRCTQGYEIPADQPALTEPPAPAVPAGTGLYDQAGNPLSEADLVTLGKKGTPTSKDLVYDASGKLVEDHPVNVKNAENKVKAKEKLAAKKAAAPAGAAHVPTMSDIEKKQVYEVWGYTKFNVLTPPEKIWDAVNALSETMQSIKDAQLTPLDVLQIIDQENASALGVPSLKGLEHKMADWMQTSDGQDYISGKVTKAVKSTTKPAPVPVVVGDADLAALPADLKKLVFDAWFKNNATLKSTGAKIWDEVGQVVGLPAVKDAGLSRLDVLRIIDEQGAAKLGVQNLNLYEKKVVTWLKTPSGQKYAAGVKPVPKAATAAKPAKVIEYKLPELTYDLVDTADSTYTDIDVAAAQTMQDGLAPWTASEKAGLRFYTSNNYREMNGFLRTGQYTSDATKKKIMDTQAGMRPSTRPMTLYRGTNPSQFGLGHGAGLADLEKLVGKTMEDRGFMSTSVGGRAAFGGKVLLQIEAPTGTPMAFVKSISHYRNENEMLLAAGTRYRVLSVTQTGNQIVVRVRVTA